MACACKGKTRKRLKARVSIETATDVDAADGSISRTWGGAVSRWGDLAPAGQQPDGHNKVGGHATYQLFLRGDSTTRALSPSFHRVVYDSREFDIVRSALDENRDIVVTLNDYTGMIDADALTYDGNTYDIIPRHAMTTEDEGSPGLGDTLVTQLQVRMSDFDDGATAIGATCTLFARTYRIASLSRPFFGNWYLLGLVEEFAN